MIKVSTWFSTSGPRSVKICEGDTVIPILTVRELEAKMGLSYLGLQGVAAGANSPAKNQLIFAMITGEIPEHLFGEYTHPSLRVAPAPVATPAEQKTVVPARRRRGRSDGGSAKAEAPSAKETA